MPDITMPKLSDTMEEGKILRWLKQPGEAVQAGDILVEVETDKADMEIEAEQTGTLREIRLHEGEAGAVGAVIAVLEEPGSAGEAASRAAPTAGATPTAPAAIAPPPVPAPAAAPAEPAVPRDPAPQSPPASAGREASPPAGTTVKVSPLARTRAAELGIDAEALRGTGPGGRVTRKDVEEAYRSRSAAAPPDASPSPDASAPPVAASPSPDASAPPVAASPSPDASAPAVAPATASAPRPPAVAPATASAPRPPAVAPATASARRPPAAGTVTVRPPPRSAPAAPSTAPARFEGGDVQRVPLTGMRAAIARRMTESKREAPHFYVSTIADMERAVQLRAAFKEAGGAAASVTYNHIVLKACADALAAVPEMNARFAGDAIEILPDVNLGVATALPEGLIVPVLHRADQMDLFALAAGARALAEKARQRNFASADLSGATFSVSNLGMYEVENFTAVLNPPQAGILAVGSVAQRPAVRDGSLVVAHTVHLTVSCDHRAVDGARAAEFLQEVRARLENPVGLLVPRTDP